MSLSVRLPDEQGRIEPYRLLARPLDAPRAGGFRSRIAYAAAHVVADPLAAVPDSMFDHSEDVEFILDPMTLHRGRPAVVRASGAAQGQQATITF